MTAKSRLVLISVTVVFASYFNSLGFREGARSMAPVVASLEAQLAEAIKRDGERPANIVQKEWSSKDMYDFAHEVEFIENLENRDDGFMYFVTTVRGSGKTERFANKARVAKWEAAAFNLLKGHFDRAQAAEASVAK